MSKYKIVINFIECENENENEHDPEEQIDGSFEMVINEKDALNIDQCEKAFLETTYLAMRKALSDSLSHASKKNLRNGRRKTNKDRYKRI